VDVLRNTQIVRCVATLRLPNVTAVGSVRLYPLGSKRFNKIKIPQKISVILTIPNFFFLIKFVMYVNYQR